MSVTFVVAVIAKATKCVTVRATNAMFEVTTARVFLNVATVARDAMLLAIPEIAWKNLFAVVKSAVAETVGAIVTNIFLINEAVFEALAAMVRAKVVIFDTVAIFAAPAAIALTCVGIAVKTVTAEPILEIAIL